MGAAHDITDAQVASHGRLRLRFADGAEGELDVRGHLNGPMFEVARTADGFQRVRIDPESHTVCWPGGADLAPDVLHRAVSDGTDIATARDVLTREMQARLKEVATVDAV